MQQQVFYFILNSRLWRKILVEENLWNDKRLLQYILDLSFDVDAFDELSSIFNNQSMSIQTIDDLIEFIKYRSDMNQHVQ